MKSKIFKNVHYLSLGIAIVMFWRGIWMLLDLYFVPDNDSLSALLCIIIAIIIFLLDNGHIEELDL